jgi:glycosyltransferase involved in cell wall biosynthesis
MPLLFDSAIEVTATPVIDSVRRRILICVPRYLPGYKSGGPIRAIANAVAHLSSQFDFFVVTRDRDAGDTERYPGIQPDTWHHVGAAQVLYCSSINSSTLRRAFNEVQPDVISLNSFQDDFTRIMVRLRRMGAFGKTPIILAPRGEFSPGAMQIKQVKKWMYRRITRLLGLHEKLSWQVSAPREMKELQQAAPVRHLLPGSVHVVCELSDTLSISAPHIAKVAGSLKLTFISRISEKKNLHFLLALLAKVRGKVMLTIYGPVAAKDEAYWQTCRSILPQLPSNISVTYRGPLDHAEVPSVLHEHHFFVLPTRGENFCHAAVESFVNGTPVILSDQTPWVNLEAAGAGFDIPVEDAESWIFALQKCADMDQLTYSTLLEGTLKYSQRFSAEEATRQHVAMFDAALASAQS